MITLPSYFRPKHEARLVVHHDQATADPYANLENLASDATATARWALEQLHGWAPDDFAVSETVMDAVARGRSRTRATVGYVSAICTVAG